jgi:hypothetical protein
MARVIDGLAGDGLRFSVTAANVINAPLDLIPLLAR